LSAFQDGAQNPSAEEKSEKGVEDCVDEVRMNPIVYPLLAFAALPWVYCIWELIKFLNG
jgi:hypothetical protein